MLKDRPKAGQLPNMGAGGMVFGGFRFNDDDYTFLTNSSYIFVINFNSSASTVEYDGGTLAPGTADVRVNNTLVLDDFVMRNTTLSSRAFAMKVAGGMENTYAYTIDDIYFYDGAVVPEPSALALGGLGLAMLGGVRYRRRRPQAGAGHPVSRLG